MNMREASSSPTSEVGYVTRFVPAYRMAVMRALSSRLGGGLIVGAGDPPSGSTLADLIQKDRNDGSGLRRMTLRNVWLRGESLHWQSSGAIFSNLGPSRVLLIEESPRTISLRSLLRKARRKGLKTVLWGHFSSIHRPFDREQWRDRRRLETASMADALLTYTDEWRDRLTTLMPDKPIFSARNTLDTSTLFPLGDQLIGEGRPAIRARLGLPDMPTLLFLGRMIPEKKPHLVIEAASRVASRIGGPVSVVMVGDGPERMRVEALAAERGVKLACTGALRELEASAPWIAACDVLVNPGYLGLSVNHALSLGVPIVAPKPGPDGVGHSPEWVFVKDGVNGLFGERPLQVAPDPESAFSPDAPRRMPKGLLPKAVDIAFEDAQLHAFASTLADAVCTVLEDKEGYQQRSAAFARTELGMDRMVQGMLDAIAYVSPEVNILSSSEGA